VPITSLTRSLKTLIFQPRELHTCCRWSTSHSSESPPRTPRGEPKDDPEGEGEGEGGIHVNPQPMARVNAN
jgi:hypothetical protein